MKTSIMDKIRILRSSRMKTNPKKGKPPSGVVAAPPALQPAVSEASQQWVPLLVFDISQATATSVLQNIPVTSSLPITNNPVKKGISPKKAILVTKNSSSITSTTNKIPIMTKRITFRSSIPDTQHIIINAGEPTEDPLALPVAESTKEPGQFDEGEICSEKPVKCVLCDQNFFSLEDMQAHYLSTHKARKSRDTRKRKSAVENCGAQGPPNPISQGGVDQETDESAFPMTDKTDVEPKCPLCSIAFRTDEEVKCHIKEVHSYVCSECNSTFYSLFQFTSHRCIKGPKKVKKVRKKNNNVTVLKPGVAKVMDSFVKIQPKTKKKAKNSSAETQTKRSPPALKRISNTTSPVSADDAVSNNFSEIGGGAEVSAASVLSLAGNDDVSGSEEMVPINQVEAAEEMYYKDSYMLPSITTTYTLKVPQNTSDKNSERKNIQVIETSNIYEAKKLVQQSEVVDNKISRTEVIREKIAQLKNNPNVSISWMPTLRIKKQDDGDFVCGRCNVICDDMEDYMDHIQDCLHITSVTLEPTSNPPRRLLRLQYDFSSFGVWETGNKRYSVNRNLINKLKAALPQTKECNSAYSCNTKTKAMASECTLQSQVNLTGQALRDLVDVDYGYESHESVDVNIGGSVSPVSPVAKQGGDSSSARSTKSSNGGQALQNQLGVAQSKVFVSSTKGTQPMVVIPFDSKANFKLNVMSDQLSKSPGKCEMAENVGEVLTPSNDLTSQRFRSSSSSSRAASPMGMLLDQDEIKMEVEEEVVEDHFEIKVEADDDGQDIESDGDAHTPGNGHEVLETELGDVTSSDEETEKLDMLECRMCKKKYSTTASLRAHLSKKHRVALGPCYTCYLCGAIGQSKATLKRHLLRTHGEHSIQQPELLRKCRHCGQGLASQAAVYKHISLAHAEELHQYHRCPTCPALVRSRPSLLRHFGRSHPGVKFPGHEAQRCPECNAGFRSRTALKVHLKAKHPEALLHKCKICGASFKYFYLLNRHIKACHEGKPTPTPRRRYKCADCEREYSAKSRLEKHINHVHTNPEGRVFRCTICNLTFSTSSHRVRHYRSVHRDRNTPHCSECTKYFETVEELNIHRQEHKMNCAVCHKSFLRRDSLREHLLIHNGPKLPCPYCSKTFTQNSNLKRHIRIHTGEKPYKCTFCSKSFGDKSACNSHIRVHTGAERCKCHLCGASFSKRQKLNYHMRKHTGQGLLYCPLCIKPTTNSYALKKHIETHQQALVLVLLSMGISSQVEDCHQLALKALYNLACASVENSECNQMSNTHFLESDTCAVNDFNTVDHLHCDDAENVDVVCKREETVCEIENEKFLKSNENLDQTDKCSSLRGNKEKGNKDDIEYCSSVVEEMSPIHKSLADTDVILSVKGSQQDRELGEPALKDVLSGGSDPLVDVQCCNIKREDDSIALESESENVEKKYIYSCVATQKHLMCYEKLKNNKISAPHCNDQSTLDCDNLIQFRDNVSSKRHLDKKEDTPLKKLNKKVFLEEGNTFGIPSGIYEEPVVVLTRLLEDIVESHCRQTEIDSFKPTLGDQLVEQCLQVIMNDDVASEGVPKDAGDDVGLDLRVHQNCGLQDSDRCADHGLNRIIDKHKKPYNIVSPISCQNDVGVDTNYSHGIRLRDVKFFTSLNNEKLLEDSRTIISDNENKCSESDSCNFSRESAITDSSAITNKEISLFDSSKLHICKSPETCVKIFSSCYGENLEEDPIHYSCRDVCSQALTFNRSKDDLNSESNRDNCGFCLAGMYNARHQVKSTNSSVHAQRESSPANIHECQRSNYYVKKSCRQTENSSPMANSEVCSESNTSKLCKIKLLGSSKKCRIESILHKSNRINSSCSDHEDKDILIKRFCEKRGQVIITGDDKEHSQNVDLHDGIHCHDHGRTVNKCKGNFESFSGTGCDVTPNGVRKDGDEQDHTEFAPAQERTATLGKRKGNCVDSPTAERQLQLDGSIKQSQTLKPRLAIVYQDKDHSASVKLEENSPTDSLEKLSIRNGVVSLKKPISSVKVKEISHLWRISQAVPPRPMCPLVEKSTKFFSSPSVSVSYKSYVPAEGSIEERTCE